MGNQKFEIKEYFDVITGKFRKDIFVDQKLFEYEVDRNSLEEAKKMGGYYYIAAQRDIQKHFLDSFSDFMGRPITQDDIKNATKTGLI